LNILCATTFKVYLSYDDSVLALGKKRKRGKRIGW